MPWNGFCEGIFRTNLFSGCGLQILDKADSSGDTLNSGHFEESDGQCQEVCYSVPACRGLYEDEDELPKLMFQKDLCDGFLSAHQEKDTPMVTDRGTGSLTPTSR